MGGCWTRNRKMWNFVLIVGVLCIAESLGLFEGCDYYKEMKFGEVYFVLSPGYPENYPANTNCRYAAVAPLGHRIRLQCNDFDLPNSMFCLGERMDISLTGRPDLLDAQRYCGTGQIREKTDKNKLVFAIRSTLMSLGGRFSCMITVASANCDCGKKKSSRIVGGVETEINEFPMMAALVDIKQKQVFCGATIISNFHAVTAAHCLARRQINTTAFLVGDHALDTGNETSFSHLYVIKQFIIHENYSSNPVNNDIALIRTDKPISYNEGVGPVCLPWRFRDRTFAGDAIEACGWGSIEFGGPLSNTLMKVSLGVIENKECAINLPDIHPSQICTYAVLKDTCQSDSGGPLFYTSPSSGLVYNVGIVSYGVACATRIPSVSTRITEYLDWIMAKTPSTFYCYK